MIICFYGHLFAGKKTYANFLDDYTVIDLDTIFLNVLSNDPKTIRIISEVFTDIKYNYNNKSNRYTIDNIHNMDFSLYENLFLIAGPIVYNEYKKQLNELKTDKIIVTTSYIANYNLDFGFDKIINIIASDYVLAKRANTTHVEINKTKDNVFNKVDSTISNNIEFEKNDKTYISKMNTVRTLVKLI